MPDRHCWLLASRTTRWFVILSRGLRETETDMRTKDVAELADKDTAIRTLRSSRSPLSEVKVSRRMRLCEQGGRDRFRFRLSRRTCPATFFHYPMLSEGVYAQS